MANIQLFIQ